ncbi:MAG: hypothetical protein ACC663_01505 [Gammaproteobacteria bacterium]
MTDLISSTLGNTIVGIVFLSLAASLTFLMFYAWKFPFDHEKLKSSAPPRVINLHRLLGYLFVIIYIYIMWNMVPRPANRISQTPHPQRLAADRGSYGQPFDYSQPDHRG